MRVVECSFIQSACLVSASKYSMPCKLHSVTPAFLHPQQPPRESSAPCLLHQDLQTHLGVKRCNPRNLLRYEAFPQDGVERPLLIGCTRKSGLVATDHGLEQLRNSWEDVYVVEIYERNPAEANATKCDALPASCVTMVIV